MKTGALRGLRMPHSRFGRISIGLLLVVGGLVGFLPVVGFWMLPLGLVMLSVDIPWIRRRRRRIQVWWGRKVNSRKT
jgi:hypothetical protein